MIQAFDVLLQIPVTADIAAKNRIDEPFRYECLCCGEEVYIAATNSTKKAPHFRHRRGNSDRECELYLGSTGIAGALNAAQKRTHSRTEIYFDIKQKIFYAAVSFPKEKLQEFEDKSCILEFHSTYNSPPYEKVRINHQNFAPDSMVQFPLKLTTNDCYITISGANYRSHYEILSNNDFPTFFKITLGENSGNFARRIVGGKVYTNTNYYIIAKNQKIIQKIVDLGENIAISAVDEINALGSTIYGATLEILSVTPDLSNLFSYFNYSLEVSENITPLWPPLYSVDGVLCSNKKKVYLLSSFTLVPHSNISCENDRLELFDDVFELDITLPVRISRNNVNMQIEQRKNQYLQLVNSCEQVTATKVRVTESDRFYLIDSDGYRELSAGTYFLTRFSKIVKYKSNYPEKIYHLPEVISKSRVAILRDALAYYKVTIPFDETLLRECPLSSVAQTYLETCRISKRINSKALELIKAGIV